MKLLTALLCWLAKPPLCALMIDHACYPTRQTVLLYRKASDRFLGRCERRYLVQRQITRERKARGNSCVSESRPRLWVYYNRFSHNRNTERKAQKRGLGIVIPSLSDTLSRAPKPGSQAPLPHHDCSALHPVPTAKALQARCAPMSSNTCPRDSSQLLSRELWTKVLTQVHSDQLDVYTRYESNQQEMLNLRLVCHIFKTVYDSEPRFPSSLLLPISFSNASFPSLTAWLQKHAANIQSVYSEFGSPSLDVALSGLVCHNTALIAVDLSACSNSALQLLPSFQTLTRVELGLDASQTLNLLLTLPALQALHLTGTGSANIADTADSWTFTMDELPRHLTELLLSRCVLESRNGCLCVTSLQSIQMRHSVLTGLHVKGLLACHALQQLHCTIGGITASVAGDGLDVGLGHALVPANLSMLTSLTELILQMDGVPEFDISCLCALKALQSLRLVCAGSMIITPGLSALKQLTCLTLRVEDSPSIEAFLKLEVDWAAMHALQHVQICSYIVLYDERLLTLSRMQYLKRIDLLWFTPEDDMIEIFARLVYWLARDRPEVVVDMGGNPLADGH